MIIIAALNTYAMSPLLSKASILIFAIGQAFISFVVAFMLYTEYALFLFVAELVGVQIVIMPAFGYQLAVRAFFYHFAV